MASSTNHKQNIYSPLSGVVCAFEKRTIMTAIAVTAMMIGWLPCTSFGQEEVASSFRRYKGYYESHESAEEYEVRPFIKSPKTAGYGVTLEEIIFLPKSHAADSRTRQPDSHRGIKFYEILRCNICHAQEARDIHTTLAKITCGECHGGEPISGIQYYYSPLNSIRRYAYLCSKCHEGSTASFAEYIVHDQSATLSEENPAGARAITFSYWFMLLLLISVIGFFVPYSFIVGAREFIEKIRTSRSHD
jgi:hypothetical protein